MPLSLSLRTTSTPTTPSPHSTRRMTGVHRHPRCCQSEPVRCRAAARTQSVSAINDAATTAAFTPVWSLFSRRQVSRTSRQMVKHSCVCMSKLSSKGRKIRPQTTLDKKIDFDFYFSGSYSKTALSGNESVLFDNIFSSKQYAYQFGLCMFWIVLDWLVQPKPRWLGGNGWLLDGPEEVLQGEYTHAWPVIEVRENT